MNVIHISSGSVGGAGNAAKRLHAELLDSGVQSYFLTLNLSDNSIDKKIEVSRSLPERVWGFLGSRFHAKISKLAFFSIWSTRVRGTLKAIIKYDKQDTILHIHNWYNILTITQISHLLDLGYKIVFTLHDQRIFTGGCHFTFSCSSFKSECAHCPQIPSIFNSQPTKNLALQEKILSQNRNVRFIAPSNWIAGEISASKIKPESRVRKITNLLTKEDIALENRLAFSEWITIGVASVHPYSFIKGGNFVKGLEAFLSTTNHKVKLEFMKNYPEDGTANFWQKIDFLLVPSITDNSPNVIHEAKRIGLPVIATNVGGIPEMLSKHFDLVLDVGDIDFEEIVHWCKNLISSSDYSLNQLKMRKNYSDYIGSPLIEHISVYQELLNL